MKEKPFARQPGLSQIFKAIERGYLIVYGGSVGHGKNLFQSILFEYRLLNRKPWHPRGSRPAISWSLEPGV